MANLKLWQRDIPAQCTRGEDASKCVRHSLESDLECPEHELQGDSKDRGDKQKYHLEEIEVVTFIGLKFFNEFVHQTSELRFSRLGDERFLKHHLVHQNIDIAPGHRKKKRDGMSGGHVSLRSRSRVENLGSFGLHVMLRALFQTVAASRTCE